MEELSCPVCYNVFLAESALGDRRPKIICTNGHTVCSDCYTSLEENDMPCPECRAELLPTPIINRMLLDVIQNYMKALDRVPEISVGEMTLAETPFASGAFADVYDAKWHNQDVAVKALRSMPEIDKQIKQLQMEANLAIGLHHPNIVRLYGTTKLSGSRFGIVMEKVDNGSLDRYIWSLEQQVAVIISLGVIDGLDYVHSRKVAHRDLKPQNILLSGPQMNPKIADFGVSKVIQTVITNSAMVGTPKYAAPEMLSPGSPYGCSADIFSLAIILFEMFSGQPAEQGLGTNVMMIMLAVVQGKRPKIPANFPAHLKPLIE
jgi:serine/threonine protein kinase